MDITKRAWILRFLGEALAIFAGVAFALAADDWRQARSEADEASASLALLVEDLRGDSAEFATRESTMARHASAAAWLIEEWDRAHQSPDSAEAAIGQFATGGLARFNRAAFDGLSDSNRLRLIESDSMRTAITRYYQRTQVNISQYWELSVSMMEQLQDALAPHVRYPTGRNPGSLWPSGDEGPQLRHPWSQVAADPILQHRIHQYGVFSGFLAIRYGQGQEVAGELLQLLEAR